MQKSGKNGEAREQEERCVKKKNRQLLSGNPSACWVLQCKPPELAQVDLIKPHTKAGTRLREAQSSAQGHTSNE